MTENKKDRKMLRFIAISIFIFFLSIYIFSASGSNFYHTDSSQLRLYVARSIVERADLAVPKVGGIRGADGRYYSWVGIGSALLAVPFYVVGKIMGNPEVAVSLMNQLFGAATGVLIFLFAIALGYSRRASLLVAIFYGLGTIAWPLAKQPFDHIVETFFILLSVYFMYFYSVDKKVSYLLYSAASIGFAFLTRSYSILVIPPLFLMVAVDYMRKSGIKTAARLIAKDIVLFFIVLLPFISLFLWYNYYRFGSVFETGYTLIAGGTGFDNFTSTSFLTGLRGFLISPGKGFFYYSPVAILFFFSIKSFMKKHPGLGISFVFIMISYLLFLSKYVFWHGDWAWGPRFLLVLTPFLIITLAEIFDSSVWKNRKLLRIIVCIIFVVSLIVQIAAVSVDFQKYFLVLRFIEKENFFIAQGSGMPTIIEPPAEIYNDWKKSPILAQFVSIYAIAREMKSYRHFNVELKEDASIEERMKANPYMSVFDFWWLYIYFSDGSYAGFIAAVMLLLSAMYTSVRLWKAVR